MSGIYFYIWYEVFWSFSMIMANSQFSIKKLEESKFFIPYWKHKTKKFIEELLALRNKDEQTWVHKYWSFSLNLKLNFHLPKLASKSAVG